MRIAVAGATGRVGHHVVSILQNRGHDVVPISRSNGVDVVSGDGLEAALAGVECIVDAATGPSSEFEAASAFFTTAARNLQEAGEKAGVRRIVMVSIIGIEKFRGGYNAAKVAHERAMLAGPVPVRILRAAQFHEFVEEFIGWGTRDGVAYVPRIRTQLVAAATVAEGLVDLALGPDAEATPAPVVEVAGPRVEDLASVAALAMAGRDRPLEVREVRNADDPDAALMETDALLPGPGAFLAGPTFEQWLNAAR